jgi:Arc/MetJ-type ribon-helix-helix transcriptional regulator
MVHHAMLPGMARKKAVVSAEPDALAAVQSLVRRGKYASVSEFMREAMAEKLGRLRQTRLNEHVARYCRDSDLRDADDLIAQQAFPRDDEP